MQWPTQRVNKTRWLGFAGCLSKDARARRHMIVLALSKAISAHCCSANFRYRLCIQFRFQMKKLVTRNEFDRKSRFVDYFRRRFQTLKEAGVDKSELTAAWLHAAPK